MVLLSKKGIYIAHYFENIAFSVDRSTPQPYRNNKDGQAGASRYTVQQPLRRGRVREQDSLAANVNDLDDDSLQGFLVIPSTGPSEPGGDDIAAQDPYREWWERIKTTVGDILPRLQEPARWHEYKYEPQQEEQIIRDDQDNVIWEPSAKTSSG
ncbi:hypothetical protein PG996_015584 [Apiospora saccharicola]|uniref:Uncharacterized protein n=1 Tax=Apiospora saccharicola TaxID=335842 RepID=A0ABR1TLJ8_9PEZI